METTCGIDQTAKEERFFDDHNGSHFCLVGDCRFFGAVGEYISNLYNCIVFIHLPAYFHLVNQHFATSQIV